MALAALIALAITVFVLYLIISRTLVSSAEADTSTTLYRGASGTVATLSTSTTESRNTTTTSGKTVVGSILVRPNGATASSSLTATNITDFRPTNLLDGDPFTAWVEGAKGTGVGQWVQFDFNDVITLVRVEISNGYQKDDDLFADYIRVKSLELQFSDDSSQVVELQDDQGIQIIEPEAPKEIDWVRFTILSVYPSYKFADAALSDIRVYETLE